MVLCTRCVSVCTRVCVGVVTCEYRHVQYIVNVLLFVLQPLPEHGVYTVFVNLGNTKIEVSTIHYNYYGVECKHLMFHVTYSCSTHWARIVR